ncbi:AMP-dependent synthetase and ligase [Alcanivorax hongdengensis A-11-3]|uniref:AMP-dependent synthetase and ligase n=1 Tax=Alcanivorax hongdengensis A-11-3 TaxID=1177179 RepID=L0WCT4_9GAMM|nr:AMP-binding protein [Alcanivorax hongdengensis]EKF73555.1 AMP-dependent synthetase and ligase [Alcanivorax hongdengensis A-11-3]
MHTDNRPWLQTYKELGCDWQALPDLPDSTLSDYIRQHAETFPEREALVFLGQAISYAELNRLADRLAGLLLDLGCRPGDVLGVQLPNTPQYVVAFIAAARLGMVTTSISPLMTTVELTHQANDARVKVMLTLAPFWQGVIQPAADNIDTLSAVLVSSPTELAGAPLPPVDEKHGKVRVLSLLDHLSETPLVPLNVPLDDVLYLQYTGGTTGLPKGAQLTSRNLFMNNVQANVFYGFEDGQEIVASAFPLFHIGGAAVLFNALRTASTFLLIPDPRDLAHFINEMKTRPPTVLAAVPALYQGLCAHPDFQALDFSRLRIAVSGAAPFAVEEIQRLEEVVGKGKFFEVYGMTETSPVLTLNPARRIKVGCVGIPLPGTDVRIVDAEDGVTEMPLGEAGEIVATGPQVMKGYLAMPDATAKALREHDGRVWMHTGDIGVMDDEGYIRVCDRSKDMLIVGGYKVFSVEVENRVQALPWVALCAVVGRPDEARPGNDVVQLFVQLQGEPGDQPTRRQELEDYCRANLSPYKVPREIFFVDEIPLTSVGKLDKKALRANNNAAPQHAVAQ